MNVYDLCFVINKNYIGQFIVTIVSLFEKNHNKFNVNLLNNDLDDNDKELLIKVVAKYNNTIEFYEINDDIFDGLPKMGYDNSYTAYYKVLIPYKLSHLSSVLYLDCDIVIKGDITKIFEESKDCFICCASDFNINKNKQEHVLKINGNLNNLYFNSGVMLFNFKFKNQIVNIDEVLNYIKNHRDDIVWHDQDILNHFYSDKCHILDEKYNYLTTYKNKSDFIFKKGKRSALIVHYANWKPWNNNYIGKYYRLYYRAYKFAKKNYYPEMNFLKKRNLFSMLKLFKKYLLR